MLFFKLDDYPICNDAVGKCIEYLKKNPNLPAGTKEELEEGIRIGVTEYETMSSDEKAWEAHRKFVDLQVMLEGSEVVELGTTTKMENGEFDEEKDFLPLFGKAESKVTLSSGYAVLLMPDDAHKPGVMPDDKKTSVYKAIFKISLDKF